MAEKVRVTFEATVTIDRESWRHNYGDEPIGAIEEATLDIAQNAIAESFGNRGISAEVGIKGISVQ